MYLFVGSQANRSKAPDLDPLGFGRFSLAGLGRVSPKPTKPETLRVDPEGIAEEEAGVP